MLIEDISDIFKNTEFTVFKDVLNNKGIINAIVAKNAADKYSRKDIDALTETVKKDKASGLAYLKFNEEITGSIAKVVTENELKVLKEKYGIGYYSLNNEDVYADPKIDVIYCAVPNGLHYEVAKRALECGKHVIVEKPFTASYAEAKELIDLAKKKKLIIYEAITLRHMPNYRKIKELLPEIGEMKMVDINFSQYSSRYDKFKKGITLPAFDPKQAGGSLMDLGVYSIHFVLGLFGMPKKVNYFANIRKKIDTDFSIVIYCIPEFFYLRIV